MFHNLLQNFVQQLLKQKFSRAVRNAKLAETDWTQSRDVTLSNDSAWQTYRQALRDITDTYSDLDSVSMEYETRINIEK